MELITARMARNPQVYSACRPCSEHGALYQATFGIQPEQEAARETEDAQKRVRRKSGRKNGEAHAEG
jgi:hypothetical protein